MIKRLLVTALLLAACGDAQERNSPPPGSPADAASACRHFTREGLNLKAKNRAELQADLGDPLNKHEWVEPNRHVPNVQDTIIRLDYDGLTVQVRRPGPGGEMFEYVAVNKRKWVTFPYFRPGVKANAVVAVLGEPHRREGNHLVYNCGESEADAPVVFETNGDAVQRIVFNYYVD